MTDPERTYLLAKFEVRPDFVVPLSHARFE